MFKEGSKIMKEISVGSKRNSRNPNSRTFEERQMELDAIEKAEAAAEKRKKNSPYKKWYQFNLAHNKDMMWLAKNASKAHLILLFLLEQMDGYNAVMCSYQALCEALDIGRTTASTAVKVLKDKGFIAILKSGTSNVYVVNDELAWKSWGKNRKYCKFPANVILSANENPEYAPLETTKLKQVNTKARKKTSAIDTKADEMDMDGGQEGM
jgi:hypothetical protein